jgi:hypothetical protein
MPSVRAMLREGQDQQTAAEPVKKGASLGDGAKRSASYWMNKRYWRNSPSLGAAMIFIRRESPSAELLMRHDTSA